MQVPTTTSPSPSACQSCRRASAPISAAAPQSHDDATEEILQEGDIALDAAAHTVSVAGTDLHLTPKEFDLLRVLLRNNGKVMTHKALLRAVWGPTGETAAGVPSRPHRPASQKA